MILCRQQVQLEDGKYYKRDITDRVISCPVVWEYLRYYYGKKVYAKINLTTSIFERVPETSALAEWLWEGYCHTHILSR